MEGSCERDNVQARERESGVGGKNERRRERERGDQLSLLGPAVKLISP